MNWTHRIKLEGWGCWYLIDVSNPKVVYDEHNKYGIVAVYDGWFEEVKMEKSFQIEELNFSLENE